MDDKDTIYRQDAIDAVNDVLAEYIPTLMPWQERIPLECALKIKALPSAQPELADKIRAIGYTGKEGRIYIGGRLFAVRELPQ